MVKKDLLRIIGAFSILFFSIFFTNLQSAGTSIPDDIATSSLIGHSVTFLLFAGIVMVLLFCGRASGSHNQRLSELSSQLRIISESDDLSNRIRFDGNDNIADIAVSINTILESLQRAQDTIVRREAAINTILQAMPDMMFRIKRDGTICNYKLSTDKCVYESPGSELNIHIDDILPTNIATMELKVIHEALSTNKMQTMQYTMPVRGDMRDFEVRIVVSGDDEVLAVVKDITEIKQADEMRRKDLLLKEIHHRVKNNLQIISSLLSLQSRKFNDIETIEAFRESQNRAKSMAIAHEKLYQSKNLENIDIGAYVDTLTMHLLNSYGFKPCYIKININIKNITLKIDTAIPLGLIINELVSNALKHAFKDKAGEVQIDIYQDPGDTYKLVVRDNGIGFPEGFDFRNTNSLGMQLVVSLVEQIEGKIELKKDNGTEFRIAFEEVSYMRRDC